jgi:hypothetical protein
VSAGDSVGIGIILWLTNAPRFVYTSGMVRKKNTAVRVKERDLEELEQLALREDETVSSLIRQAIREFLDRKKAQQGERTGGGN